MNIDFYLNVINRRNLTEDRKFFYQCGFNKDKLLLSHFGNRISDVTVDYRQGVVRGFIFDFEESQKERLLETIFMQPLRFILAHRGLFFLHAAVVNKEQGCILISGKQNSGKTTLAFAFAQNGFDFLADDDCFIKSVRDKAIIIPFRTKIGINDKIFKKCSGLKKLVLKNYCYGGKRRISLCHISTATKSGDYRCKIVLFPKYRARSKIYLNRLSKEEALKRLVEENAYMYNVKGCTKLSVENFWILHNLINQVSSFELVYNDERLNQVPAIAKGLSAYFSKSHDYKRNHVSR